jgi:hypothetical protein
MTRARIVPPDWLPNACTITRKSGEIVRFYVSQADLDLATGVTFNSGYLRHRWRGGYLHQLIAARLFPEIPKGYQVDHIDRNRLNNVRTNFRLSTMRGQRLNGSRFLLKGYQYQGSRWGAFGFPPNGRINLGVFDTEEEARQCARAFRQEQLRIAEYDGTYIYPPEVFVNDAG